MQLPEPFLLLRWGEPRRLKYLTQKLPLVPKPQASSKGKHFDVITLMSKKATRFETDSDVFIRQDQVQKMTLSQRISFAMETS